MEELEKRKIVGPDLGGGRGREVTLKNKDADEVEDGDLPAGEDDRPPAY